MRYSYTPDVEAFRQEVRDFIAQELPPEAERPEFEDEAFKNDPRGEYNYVMGFQKKLAARKWLAMAWPTEFGGGGASHMHQLVYNEEMAYAGAPTNNMGIMWVGPSLMLHGTEEQKREYVPPIVNAETWWCTLYSEPGAGSDLASLQTRAVRDGDEFVVNGQKMWTTGGHNADWGWLATRTDPDAPKHRGISLFLLNMRTPGVTVRPLINMADRHGFNEVFLEDVRIPAKNLVGELNRGWYLLAGALDFERSGIQSYAGGRRQVEKLVALARQQPALVAQRPGVRHALAERAIEVNVGIFLAYRVATMQARGLQPNHEASCSKVFGSELSQRIAQTGMELLGPYAQLRKGSPALIEDLATGYVGSVAATIAAGTSEIQRNIIATRGLGLARD